jgi:hypothetical protein
LSLGTLISSKEDALVIANDIAQFFKPKLMDNLGNVAEAIVVNDIKYDTTQGKGYLEYNLLIHFVSDQGQLHQPVVLRQYENVDEFNLEIHRYGEIVERSLLFQDLNMSPLVKVDSEKNVVILEKINGVTIDELDFPKNLKDYILGRIYGILHGSETERVSESTAREFFNFLLTHIPFTESEKTKLLELLEKHLSYFSQCFGGFTPQTKISRENIVYQLNQAILQVDKSMVDTGGIIQASLNYEKPDDLTDDRMRDIAYHFYERMYDEFTVSGDIDITKLQIQEFFEGYKSVTSNLNLPPFREMYPAGNTLNIQIVFSTWLREVEKIQMGQQRSIGDKDLLRYSYFLLTQNVFDDLF